MLHWRGKAILEAGISDMLANRGLDEATDLVISGCSAGGLAALLHCDFWSAQVHSKGKTVCMPDSPFFVDYEGPPHYASRLAWAFVQQNCTYGLSSACVAAEKPASRCMFAEHAAKYVTSPIFMMQSVYDQWQIDNVLGSRSERLINSFGANLTSRAVGSLVAPGRPNGIFLDSCYHHCWAWNRFRIGGYTQAMAFQAWFEKRHATQSMWSQNASYPCHQCCGKSAESPLAPGDPAQNITSGSNTKNNGVFDSVSKRSQQQKGKGLSALPNNDNMRSGPAGAELPRAPVLHP
jgi:hypothetical protein